MVSIPVLLERLAHAPAAYPPLQFSQLSAFFQVSKRLIRLVELESPRSRTGTPQPPDRILALLAAQLNLPPPQVLHLWDALGDIVLAEGLEELTANHLDSRLARLAPSHDLGTDVMIASCRFCLTEGCKERDKPLQRKNDYPGYLHTRRRGSLPVRIVTLYCRSCLTSYRPNYYVRNAEAQDCVRVYYGGIPDFLEVIKHTYVEKELVVMFRMQMAFAHASGETIARMYNLGVSNDPDAKALTSEAVWQAFYLHALLSHHHRWGEVLSVPHRGHQSERFNQALDARNSLIAGTGQPHWAHACDICEKLIPPADGSDEGWTRISAAVMDGVCIGHPRCNVQYCVQRLASPRDRFCPAHNFYNDLCAIKGCENHPSDGYRTCNVAEHRGHELRKREAGLSLGKLRRRIHKHKVPQASGPVDEGTGLGLDEITDLLDTLDVLSDVDGSEDAARPSAAPVPPGTVVSPGPEPPPPVVNAHAAVTDSATPRARSVANVPAAAASGSGTSAPKLKSCLTRRWTHNEQLMVRPCGVCISRATFFESEGVSNALLFVRATFPIYFPRALPNFLFYDNACNLLAHLLASGQDWLDAIALVVDVFHALTKHKESDAFCQRNCNPTSFPELISEQEQWVFNSSACEQTNGWFGDFGPIVREMSEVHHNFLLDEMIMVYNDYRVSVLEKKGARPRLVPLHELRLPRV